MKKYISIALTAVVALFFSACSNEDIQIDRQFSISVDASGVSGAFKNIEASAGVNGISSVTEGFRLRVRVLAYNAEGKVVVNEQQYRSSYTEAGTAIPISLENGTYTFVAITDVVPPSNSFIKSIWTLSDEADINKAVLTYSANENPMQYGILGVQRQQVTITDATQNITLQPQPAGALIRIMFTGMATAASNNYRLFSLRTNYTPETVDYKDGKVSTSSKMSEFNAQGQITRNGLDYVIETSAETSDNITGGYLFFLPCEINCRFAYNTQNNTNGWCGPVLTRMLQAGIGYDATLDLTASGNVVDANSVATLTQPGASGARQSAPARSLRLADI